MAEPSPLTQKLIKDISRLDKKEGSLTEIIYEYTFNSIKKKIKIEGNITEEEKNSLLYIAVLQAVFNFDRSSSLGYAFPGKKDFKYLLEKSAFKKIYLFCRAHKTAYLIIGEILKNKKNGLKKFLSDPERLKEEAEVIYEKRKKRLEKRIHQRILFLTLFVFFIVFLSSFFLINFTLQSRVLLSLVPTLMAASLVFNLPALPSKNKKRILLEIMSILYKKKEDTSCSVFFSKEKKNPTHLLINIFYSIGFVFIAIIIFLILELLSLPSFYSAILFSLFVFTCFVGVMIKEIAKEIYMIQERERFLHVIMDTVAFPLIKVRHYILSRNENFSRPQSPRPSSKSSQKNISTSLEKILEDLRKRKEKIYDE